MGKKGTRAFILEGLPGVWRNKGTGACFRGRWDQLDVDGEGRWKAGMLNWGQIRKNRENMATQGNSKGNEGTRTSLGDFFKVLILNCHMKLCLGS